MANQIHENNTFAYDEKDVVKHISQVESGKKGYFCMGCRKAMQARKGEIRSHHFAHDPKDVAIKGKCTYSDETYRHKRAKEILQRIKQIKVPTLYKYPPVGTEGRPQKIRDSWIIHAENVRIELTFFEDENGNVSYNGQKTLQPSLGRNIIITPDVTFFDKKENPILFIEIVATHKPDNNKLLKLRKLGIDTVQIIIPKESEEEIENAFFNTSKTEWLYNYERENFKYIPIPHGDDEGILFFDEFQRKLFEAGESYECRAAQLNNLIRGLKKCLGSEQFRVSKQNIDREIQRVEDNTERSRVGLRELQEKHERILQEEFRSEEESLSREEEEITSEEREYEAKYDKYETDVSREEKNYRPECQSEIERIENDFKQLGTGPNELRDRIEELRNEKSRLEQQYLIDAERVDDSKRRARAIIAEYEGRREELSGKHSEVEKRIRDEFQGKVRIIEQQEIHLEREAIEIETRIRHSFAERNSELIRAVKEGNSRRVSGISRGLRILLETREQLSNIRERKNDYDRMRKIEEIFSSGDYKLWT